MTVTSSSGNNAVLTVADGTNNGLMTSADFSKLAAIEPGATADLTGAEIVTLINTTLATNTWQLPPVTIDTAREFVNPQPLQKTTQQTAGNITFDLSAATGPNQTLNATGDITNITFSGGLVDFWYTIRINNDPGNGGPGAAVAVATTEQMGDGVTLASIPDGGSAYMQVIQRAANDYQIVFFQVWA